MADGIAIGRTAPELGKLEGVQSLLTMVHLAGNLTHYLKSCLTDADRALIHGPARPNQLSTGPLRRPMWNHPGLAHPQDLHLSMPNQMQAR